MRYIAIIILALAMVTISHAPMADIDHARQISEIEREMYNIRI